MDARVLLLVLTALDIALGHPQCLDFRPPFNPGTNNNFCRKYSTFGCCTAADHDAIQTRRDEIQKEFKHRWRQCGNYVEELLCQKCSPYAAHIFDAESTQAPRRFPGLCTLYCSEFYHTCKDVVHYIDPTLAADQSFQSLDAFCRKVAIPSDIDYCYPELLANPIFQDQLNNTQVNEDGCLCLEEQLTLMRNPIVARHAGDASGRLFVGEQIGLVHIYFPRNKTGLHVPFLDIARQVKTSASRGDERGFFSIAFHPDYSRNGRFFVYYSTHLQDHDPVHVYGPNITIDHKIRISEIHVSPEDPNRAILDTERILIEVMEPFWNHNGGELMFGDDGFLYVFVGDGGGAADIHGFAQNKSVHLGKILRLDVDIPHPTRPYSIPQDNPFLHEPGTLPEIYALGVRNIWRCGKDRGDPDTGEGKGRILCGDVGQSAWEELDLVTKGANYGWNSREGFQCFTEGTCGQIGEEVLPVYAYHHKVGKSVTGGVFYRGCESPNLNGNYIYADYMNGQMFSLSQNASGEWDNRPVHMCENDICLNGLIGHYERYVISFGEDEEGEIYMLSTGIESSSSRAGKVYKIVDPKRRGDPAQCRHAHKGDRVDLGQLGSRPVPTVNVNVNVPDVTSKPVNSAPSIVSMNIRTCSMATPLMCVLMSIRLR